MNLRQITESLYPQQNRTTDFWGCRSAYPMCNTREVYEDPTVGDCEPGSHSFQPRRIIRSAPCPLTPTGH